MIVKVKKFILGFVLLVVVSILVTGCDSKNINNDIPKDSKVISKDPTEVSQDSKSEIKDSQLEIKANISNELKEIIRSNSPNYIGSINTTFNTDNNLFNGLNFFDDSIYKYVDSKDESVQSGLYKISVSNKESEFIGGDPDYKNRFIIGNYMIYKVGGTDITEILELKTGKKLEKFVSNNEEVDLKNFYILPDSFSYIGDKIIFSYSIISKSKEVFPRLKNVDVRDPKDMSRVIDTIIYNGRFSSIDVVGIKDYHGGVSNIIYNDGNLYFKGLGNGSGISVYKYSFYKNEITNLATRELIHKIFVDDKNELYMIDQSFKHVSKYNSENGEFETIFNVPSYDNTSILYYFTYNGNVDINSYLLRTYLNPYEENSYGFVNIHSEKDSFPMIERKIKNITFGNESMYFELVTSNNIKEYNLKNGKFKDFLTEKPLGYWDSN
jgi:hypothetical protein